MSEIEKPTRYVAVTFDTQTVMHNSYNFSGGMLAELKQFSGSPVQVVVSEIVLRELHRHLTKHTKEVHERLRTTQREARELGLTEQAVDAQPVDYGVIAQKRIERFLADIDASIVPIRGGQLPAVLDRYFNKQPPFSQGKKNEFPDAIALLTLERWARENGPLMVVSGDRDWLEFANTSPHLGGVDALALALQEFQPHLTLSAKLATQLFKRVLEGPDTDLPEEFWTALRDEVTTQVVGFRVWHGELDATVETAEIDPKRATVYPDTSRLRVVSESEGRMAVEIPISFAVDLVADVELFSGPAKLGEATLTIERYLRGNFLVHFLGDFTANRIDSVTVESLNRLVVTIGSVEEFFPRDLA